MAQRDDPEIGTLFVVVLGFAALGTPMFLYLWETLNGLLTGHADAMRLLIALPVLALFVGLLVVLSRVVRRWGTPAGPFPTDRSPTRR
jgi:hypothetical protein